ncbi:hypothetical protein N9Y60_05525 [Crocinitomicaceae bacterium]|nr:hypothetical protein [Crocinitomicaceae bacterium]MDC0257746.1 hypothetical protein [Crocinitomicaceae bacterium]
MIKKMFFIQLVLLSSCATQHVSNNRLIQKRKYTKGWFIIEHDKYRSSVTENSEVKSKNETFSIRRKDESVNDNSKTLAFNSYVDYSNLEKSRISKETKAESENRSSISIESNNMVESSNSRFEKTDGFHFSKTPLDTIPKESNSKIRALNITFGSIGAVSLLTGVVFWVFLAEGWLLIPLAIILLSAIVYFILLAIFGKDRSRTTEEKEKKKGQRKLFWLTLSFILLLIGSLCLGAILTVFVGLYWAFILGSFMAGLCVLYYFTRKKLKQQ